MTGRGGQVCEFLHQPSFPSSFLSTTFSIRSLQPLLPPSPPCSWDRDANANLPAWLPSRTVQLCNRFLAPGNQHTLSKKPEVFEKWSLPFQADQHELKWTSVVTACSHHSSQGHAEVDPDGEVRRGPARPRFDDRSDIVRSRRFVFVSKSEECFP